MSGAGAILKVVEAAYRLHDDDPSWLEGIVQAAPMITPGLGVSANVFDRDAPSPADVIGAVRSREMDPRILESLRTMFEHADPADRDRVFERGPVVLLTELVGVPLSRVPLFGALAREVGFTEIVSFNAVNPDGGGVAINMPSRRRRLPQAWREQWPLVIAHVAAGLRLQRGLRHLRRCGGSRPELLGEAILTPGGRVVHAAPRAESALGSLRSAVRSIDRARGALRRKSAEALAGWTALVDGRWSLVDRFDADGKRWVVAVANAPASPDPRALTAEERSVLHYAAIGHPNKLVSYELGIPEGTVATRLASIRRKLAVRTRTEMVDLVHAFRRARFALATTGSAEIFVGESGPTASASTQALTTAEREVAILAARGVPNEEIARLRRCSVRTIANLLHRTYRKLGIASRSELALAGL